MTFLYISVGYMPGGRYAYVQLYKNQRRQLHPTPVLLPGKPHGCRSLVGYSPWGHKESDTTEWLHFHFHFPIYFSEFWCWFPLKNFNYIMVIWSHYHFYYYNDRSVDLFLLVVLYGITKIEIIQGSLCRTDAWFLYH